MNDPLFQLRIDHYFHFVPADASKLDTIISALAVLQTGQDKMAQTVDDYIAAQTATNAQISTAVDALGGSITGVSGDVQNLNNQIAALQNSLGTLTPAQQQAFADLASQGTALAAKVQTAADSLAALDALTP